VFPAVVISGVFMPGIERCLEGPAVLDQERRVRHDEPGRTPGEGGLKPYALLSGPDRICQDQMNSASSRRMADFGLAPTICLMTCPPENTFMVGMAMMP
jgi:hypothetical protein